MSANNSCGYKSRARQNGSTEHKTDVEAIQDARNATPATVHLIGGDEIDVEDYAWSSDGGRLGIVTDLAETPVGVDLWIPQARIAAVRPTNHQSAREAAELVADAAEQGGI